MEDDYWNNQPQLSQSAGLLNQPQLSQAVGLLNQPHLEYVAEIPPSAHDVGEGTQVVDTQSIGLGDVPQVIDTQSILSAYQRYLQSVIITEAENAPTVFPGPAGGSGSRLPALRDPRPSPSLRDPRPSARASQLARAGGSIPSLGVPSPLPPARGPELSKAGGTIPALGVRDRGPELARAGGSIPSLGVPSPLPPARGPELSKAGGTIPALGVRDRGPELARAGGSIPTLGVRGPQLAPDGRGRSRETLSLPPGASNTLYIEGLPSDCTRREVAHIFRRFTGYKELRLVKRDSKYPAENPHILGFVDFVNPTCAATALRALQGYIMDEHDNHSTYLRLQFSKFPGRRFRGRGKR